MDHYQCFGCTQYTYHVAKLNSWHPFSRSFCALASTQKSILLPFKRCSLVWTYWFMVSTQKNLNRKCKYPILAGHHCDCLLFHRNSCTKIEHSSQTLEFGLHGQLCDASNTRCCIISQQSHQKSHETKIKRFVRNRSLNKCWGRV